MGAEILLVIKFIGDLLGGLLIIDTSLDGIAKAFGNKKWDTILGTWAIKLNTAVTETKDVVPTNTTVEVPTVDITKKI